MRERTEGSPRARASFVESSRARKCDARRAKGSAAMPDRSNEKPIIDRDVVRRLRTPPSEDERANWPSFTMAEVRAHRFLTDPGGWIVVRERVFDVTAFARTHPGFFNAGQVSTAIAVARALGTDATEEFEEIHSPRAWTQLADFQIGTLRRGEETSSEGGVVKPETPVPTWLSNDRDFWVRYGGEVSRAVVRATTREDEDRGGEDDDDVVAEVSVETIGTEEDAKASRKASIGRAVRAWGRVVAATGVSMAAAATFRKRRAANVK